MLLNFFEIVKIFDIIYLYGDNMIENLNGEELKDYILSCSKEKRIEYLKDENIRNKFLESKNHYPFIWLIQSLKNEELCYFIDKDMLEKILETDRNNDKMNAIMTCGNIYANRILSNDKAIEFIFDKKNDLTTYLYNLNNIFGQYIIDYSIEKGKKDLINYLGYLKKDNQIKTFTNTYITKILENFDISKEFFKNLDNEIINKLIIYPKFLYAFIDLNIDELNEIISKGFVFPIHLINNTKIIKELSNIEDTNKYRFTVNNLMKNNLNMIPIVEQEREKYVLSRINNIDDKGIFKDYYNLNIQEMYNRLPFDTVKSIEYYLKNNNDEGVLNELRKNTEKHLFEMIIDTYFNDIAYNFLQNLKIILRYVKDIDEKIIPEERLDLYKKIAKFHDLNVYEQKQLFFDYNNNIDYSKEFYEDFYNCKMHSYKKINDNLIYLNKNNSIYNKELSKEKNIDIYELDGEEFYAYVHSTLIRYHNDELVIPFKKGGSKTISLSLIGKDSIGIYGRKEDNIIFGFDKLNIENIMHISNSDSFTSHEYGTNKFQQIYTPQELLYKTIGYNEILYSEKNLNEFWPSFIVCFDEIRDVDLEMASKMNLPIVKISSLKYRKTGGINDINWDKYKTSTEASQITSYRVL